MIAEKWMEVKPKLFAISPKVSDVLSLLLKMDEQLDMVYPLKYIPKMSDNIFEQKVLTST